MSLALAVYASGRGSNLQAILDEAAAGRLDARVVLVVSDQPGAPALDRARAAGVPARLIAPAPGETRARYEQRLVAATEDAGVELVVLAGFMRLLGRTFLDRFEGRVINLHPSLLPAFPGLDAPGQALAWGVRVSGCTVHFVDAGMDSGPILLQAAVPVLPGDTRETLAARIQAEEHRLLPQAIRLIAAGRVRLLGRRVVISQTEEENACNVHS